MTSSSVDRVGEVGAVRAWRPVLDPLSLMALAAFAIAQPILSDFKAGAGFFVARRVEPIDIVLLVIALILIPGLVAVLMVWLAGLVSDRARSMMQTVFIGLFSALIAQTTLVRLWSLNWVALMVISIAIGLLAAVAYVRTNWLRSLLTYLIPAPLIFALFFLFTPPVVGLVLPDRTAVNEVSVDAPAPVVFLVLDEFPIVSLLNADGEIDASRYPNFAELASRSTWYRNTSAAHDNTLWAVPAILSGMSPDGSLLPTTANYPGNLFTLLAPSYEMHVVEPFTNLCPPETCSEGEQAPFRDRYTGLLRDSWQLYEMLLARDPGASVSVSDPFNEFMGGEVNRVNEEAATDQVGRFTEFLNGIDASSTTLHFMHVMLPHAPFHLYPSGLEYNNGNQLDGQENEVWVESFLADQGYQRHLLQVQAVDSLIGDLLDTLDAQGLFDDALVVVTADHGISFQLGEPRRGLSEGNAYEVGLVPLFIKAPHQVGGAVDARSTRTIDIVPTVAELLGMDLFWNADGHSLLGDPVTSPQIVRSNVAQPVQLDDDEEGKSAAVDRVMSLFGSSRGDFDLYGFGKYGDLVGTTTSSASVPVSGVGAEVADVGRFDHVVLDTGFVPGFVHGQVSGQVDEGLYVAVALNGEIRAVVPVFQVEADRAQFSAVLPDGAFRAGFNELELFAVSGSSQSPTMEAIDLAEQSRFELQESAGSQALVVIDSEGGSWPVDANSTTVGYVDDALWLQSGFERNSPMDLQLQGWAVNESTLEPAERVVFFTDGQFAGSVVPDAERPGISDTYQTNDVLVSGFLAKLPYFSPDDPPEIRAFALSGGKAVELVIVETAQSVISAS